MSPRTRNVCSQPDCDQTAHGQGLCNTHYRRKARGRTIEGPVKVALPEITRFMPKVLPQPNGCWAWLGTHTHDGYGCFRTGKRTDGTRTMVPAHRWAYKHFRGPIADGRELDHVVCDNRGCANPWHVEPATHKANSLRSTSPQAVNALKTHCPKGHEYTPENTYHWPGARGASRKCRACQRT